MTKPLYYFAASVLVLLALCWPPLRAEDAAPADRKPGGLVSLATLPSPELAPLFAAKVRPLLAEYCLGCHSTKLKKGELDLERFVSIDVARNDLKPWQSLVEMLDAGEMPPKGKRQPTADERNWLIEWTRRWLDVEARARAGDPGHIALRRLSNAEYNCTVRDLTGVDLQPAREFPADGAAGEGFTNASEALSMSSTLVNKYLAAAKNIADHAVMLPDGFRFSPSAHQHDWIDESLGDMHRFYNQFSEGNGQIPLRKYLAVTIQNRAALAAHTKSFADVARQDNLSPKYLEILWNTLNDARPSFVLDDLRSRWKTASLNDVPALVGQIESWQRVAWKLNDTAACIYEPWQVPVLTVTDSQNLRVKLNPQPGQNEVILYLVARTIGAAGGDAPLVLWDKARFEADKQRPLLLRDVSAVAQGMEGALREAFRDTAKYLAAAAQWRRGGDKDTVESIAKQQSLDAKRLQRWIDVTGLSRKLPGPLEPLEVKMPGSGDRSFVSGWASKTPDTLPSLMTNSTDRTFNIPGTLPGHKVVVHPTPDQYVAVAWSSPIEGRVRIEAKVSDAHAGCGNGVSWWIESQHGKRRESLAGGDIDDGKAAMIEPRESQVAPGDVVCLAIGAREHNHYCDLTLIDLTITELDGKHRVWNLSADVADNVLDGNPHADRQGNKDVWHFSRGRDNSPTTPRFQLPQASLLVKWRDLLDKPNSDPEQARLAEQLQSLLTGPAPAADGSPNAALYAALVSPGTSLVDPAELNALLAKQKTSPAVANSPFGLDPARFGKSQLGQKIPESSFATPSPSVLEIRLPAALVANREFIVNARLDPATAGNRLVQLQVLTAPPASGNQVVPAPILCSTQGSGRETGLAAIDDFRRTFPAALCFSRIVPQDPDGITLCMFFREDEPLSRLMLDADQQQRLERLWSELKYVGREAQKENESFPLFMAFASQVGLVPKFEPMREPLRVKAAAFQKELEASESKHLEQLVDFAARAYRRPLAEQEKAELLGLYETLRKKKNVSHEEALRGVLARVLVSPAFLFHLEQSPPGKEPKPVNDWELASRLELLPLVVAPRRGAASSRRRRPLARSEGAGRANAADAEGTASASAGDRVRHAMDSRPRLRRAQGEEREAVPDVRRIAARGDLRGIDPVLPGPVPERPPGDADSRRRLHVPQRNAGEALRHPRRRRAAVATSRGRAEVWPRRHPGAGERAGQASRARRAPARCCAATGWSKRCSARSCPARRRMCRSLPRRGSGQRRPDGAAAGREARQCGRVRRLPSADRSVRLRPGTLRRDRPVPREGPRRRRRSIARRSSKTAPSSRASTACGTTC